MARMAFDVVYDFEAPRSGSSPPDHEVDDA
jgi:hypothetical protein